ncbi:hypothetical protein N7528_006730 [Penicillium herquei]|nr:hypothetical protein N7528_006730 [Penicillium herquei]
MHWVYDDKGNCWIFDDEGNYVKHPTPFKSTQMSNPDNGATAEPFKDPKDIEHLKKRIESHIHVMETKIKELKALAVRLDNIRLHLIESLDDLNEEYPHCDTADSENDATEDQRQAENKTTDIQNEAIGDRKV